MLQPTALVHEAYVRALGDGQDYENRRHFFFAATRAMRNILVEDARRNRAQKRGGDVPKSDEEIGDIPIEPPSEDMLALHDALDKLKARHERPYKVVMLRYFAGFSTAEAAQLLGIVERTAKRDWHIARSFLQRALSRS